MRVHIGWRFNNHGKWMHELWLIFSKLMKWRKCCGENLYKLCKITNVDKVC